MGSGCIGLVESHKHFPPQRVGEYIKGKCTTLTQYMEQYKTTVKDLLQRLLRIEFRMVRIRIAEIPRSEHPVAALYVLEDNP